MSRRATAAARQSRATLGGAGVGVLGVAGDVVGTRRAGGPGRRGRHPAPPVELRPRLGAPGRPARRALHGAGRLRSQRGGARSRGPEPGDRRLSWPTSARSRSADSAMSQILSTHPRHEQRGGRDPGLRQDALAPADVRDRGRRDGTLSAGCARPSPIRRLAPAYAPLRPRAIRPFTQAAQAAEQKQSPWSSQKHLRGPAGDRCRDPARRPGAVRSTLQGYLLAVQGRKADARTASQSRRLALSRLPAGDSGAGEDRQLARESPGRQRRERGARPVRLRGTGSAGRGFQSSTLESPKRPLVVARPHPPSAVSESPVSSPSGPPGCRRRSATGGSPFSPEGGAPAHQHECHEPDR